MIIKTDSDFFYQLRGVAIISVGYAHSLSLSNQTLSILGALCGLIGVPLFLICSGFYYKRPINKLNFIVKKVQNIIIPWLILGSICFIISLLYKQESFSFIQYVSYMLGHGTWLYYVPVYLFIVFFYSFVPISSKVDYIIILVMLLSNTVTYYMNLGTMNSFITFYQNPLNFIGFYSIGKLWKEKHFIEFKLWWIGLILMMLIILLFMNSNMKIKYTNPYAIVFELATIYLIIYIISNCLNNKLRGGGILKKFGMYSFFIYFFHMQIPISIINKVFIILNVTQDVIQLVFKPISVIFLSYIVAIIIKKIIRLLKYDKMSRFIGIP